VSRIESYDLLVVGREARGPAADDQQVVGLDAAHLCVASGRRQVAAARLPVP
jgi:hypothetical protein